MNLGGVIMAGGAGARMRGAAEVKPLVRVRGVSLLERNACALLGAGLQVVWIACRPEQRALLAEIERLRAAAGHRGARIEALVEAAPLGTIGAAGGLRERVDTVLAVNADNLTAIDLAALLAYHADHAADLTLATHDHAVQLPYGAVDILDDRVVGYREKPTSVTRIASAVCVLGPRALAATDGRIGLPELTARVIARGHRVAAYHHAAPWIDVNEPGDIVRAAALVAAHPDRFECWARDPDREVAGAVLRDGERLLLEWRRDVMAWDTPGGKLESGESPAQAIVRELREELGITVVAGPARARFDTLEPDGRALRHHVFAPAVERTAICAREGQILEWFPIAQLPVDRSPVVDRSLANEAG